MNRPGHFHHRLSSLSSLPHRVTHHLRREKRSEKWLFDSVEHACVDVARTNGCDLDMRVSYLREFQPQRVAPVCSSCFRRAIHTHSGIGDEACRRADVDDTRFLLGCHHVREELVCDIHGCEGVDVHLERSVSGVIVLPKKLSLHNSRIVDQH
eukprot:773821-Rhodomonas_salina.2